MEEAAAVEGMTHRGNDRGWITLYLCAQQLGKASHRALAKFAQNLRPRPSGLE